MEITILFSSLVFFSGAGRSGCLRPDSFFAVDHSLYRNEPDRGLPAPGFRYDDFRFLMAVPFFIYAGELMRGGVPSGVFSLHQHSLVMYGAD